MHDAISLEKMGVPSAVICTEPFVSSANAMAKMGGIEGFPYVVLPHPLGRLAPDVLRQRAVQAAPAVLRILVGGG